MDKNGTNSSSPASPIWLICVVPTVAAQAQRGPYITYSVIVPQCIATSQNDAPDRAVVAPPGAAGPHAAALHRSAAARGVPRASRTRAGRGLPAESGTG